MLRATERHAVTIMFHLALHHDFRRLSVLDIAELVDLSTSHVDSILARLRKGGLVTGFPGRRGGYQLAKCPQRISVACIFAACSDEEHRCGDKTSLSSVALLWDDLSGEICRFLSQILLADCVNRIQRRNVVENRQKRTQNKVNVLPGRRCR